LTSRRFTGQHDILQHALYADGWQPLNKRPLLGKCKNKGALLVYVASTNRFPCYTSDPT
jgi:hypothetical protein